MSKDKKPDLQLQSMIDSHSNPFVLIDEEYNIVAANKAYQKALPMVEGLSTEARRVVGFALASDYPWATIVEAANTSKPPRRKSVAVVVSEKLAEQYGDKKMSVGEITAAYEKIRQEVSGERKAAKAVVGNCRGDIGSCRRHYPRSACESSPD